MTSTELSQPGVTVSIVSHGQMELILPLLEQLDRLCPTIVETVVLTHNVPEQSFLDAGAFRFELKRLKNLSPLGFGANHNQAFKLCTTPWFLVLNPDIRLTYDVVAPLIAGAAIKSGLLAPRILEPGKTVHEPHRTLLTPLEIYSRRKPGYPLPTQPAWIPGLFMMFRAQAFEQITGFDDRFFMYGEDFDICARLRLAGWDLQIDESLEASHEAQRDSHRSLQAFAWHVRSLLRIWTSRTFWRYRQLLRG